MSCTSQGAIAIDEGRPDAESSQGQKTSMMTESPHDHHTPKLGVQFHISTSGKAAPAITAVKIRASVHARWPRQARPAHNIKATSSAW